MCANKTIINKYDFIDNRKECMKSFKCLDIICIKHRYLKLWMFIKEYYYTLLETI